MYSILSWNLRANSTKNPNLGFYHKVWWLDVRLRFRIKLPIPDNRIFIPDFADFHFRLLLAWDIKAVSIGPATQVNK